MHKVSYTIPWTSPIKMILFHKYFINRRIFGYYIHTTIGVYCCIGKWITERINIYGCTTGMIRMLNSSIAIIILTYSPLSTNSYISYRKVNWVASLHTWCGCHQMRRFSALRSINIHVCVLFFALKAGYVG